MKPETSKLCCCYSFINDPGWLTDYEILTDELSAQLGMAFSIVETDIALADLLPDLNRLQTLALHANGSVRGKLAVSGDDLNWLQTRYEHFGEEITTREPGRLKNFVLPRGLPPVPELHQARSTAKKALRCLMRVAEENRRKKIPPEIPRFLNMLCNSCFLLTVLINQRRGVIEPRFVSQSYRIRSASSKKSTSKSR